MKAKEAVKKILASTKGKVMTPDKAAEVQAAAFADCAWEEFKRVIELRFRGSRSKVSIQSIKSLVDEYGAWGTCVSRRSKLPWLKDNCGRVAFGLFFDVVAKASGGVISISDLIRPNLAVGSRAILGQTATGAPQPQTSGPASASTTHLPPTVGEEAING